MMQVVEVDAIGPEAPEAGLTCLAYVLGVGPDVEAPRDVVVPHEAELAREDHVIPAPGYRAADEVLVLVGVGGVDHPDACVERGIDDTDGVPVGIR
jgi:hypothetical protein